ncbi:glycosyltransferase [Metabacillus herbersteinensis]|uniref:Glycosyltransferase n=1 Tax=Metabacillus herbersteinensis TaxID=283816 RepID=A0ABV6GEX5_9BACI
MQLLVLVQDYPSESNKYAMNYVHTRNLEYIRDQVEVNVLSFNTKESYTYEGINVLSYDDFFNQYNGDNIHLVISHAPNLRNHIRFLLNKKIVYRQVLFFIHGHEVMKKSKYYPQQYDFIQTSSMKNVANNLYDSLKLTYLKGFITKLFNQNKLKIIFVSEWMKDVFLENIKIPESILDKNSYIISNTMNQVFLEKTYLPIDNKRADFITIRPLDTSKYGVDLVVKLAEKHPDLTFHIYGKGKYFEYREKPENIEVFQEFLTPNDLAELLNHYHCAVMPTRLDAQGVMMCEIATYGMPIVTSDLPICKEMLGSFDNVFFMNNENVNIDLHSVLTEIKPIETTKELKQKFSLENTTLKELNVVKALLK